MFDSGFPPEWSTIKKLMWLYRCAIAAAATYVTVTGISPLALLNALAKPIRSLTQYGKCVQDGTPTPDAPVDIVCNNGALRYGALGTNLFDPSPSAILLNHYRNTSSGALVASNPNFMSAGYIPVKPNTSYVLVGRKKSDNTISVWNRIYWFDADKNFINTCPYTQNTATVATSPANAAYAQCGINYNNSSTNVVTQAEVDSYNWTFCEGTAEPATFVPFVGGIYADGAPEVLTICGKNEANVEDYTESFTNRRFVPKAIGVTLEAGVTYTFSCDVQCSVTPFDISIGVGVGGSYSKDIVTERNRTNGRNSVTFTPTAETLADYSELYVRIPRFAETQTGTVSVSKIQLERGSSASDYEPYVAPQTASVVNLFGLGDYADTQNIIEGLVNRKIGIKVFDGTESFTYTTADYIYRNSTLRTPAGTPLFCTHFQNAPAGSVVNMPDMSCRTHPSTDGPVYFRMNSCTTAEAFKAFLAAEYAKGTPVILVYVLDEATTESVEAQPLNTTEGGNTITVVANVSGIVLSVEYARAR